MADPKRRSMAEMVGWSSLAAILLVVGFVGLRACGLSILGMTFKRCPTVIQVSSAELEGDVTRRLLAQLQGLQERVALAPACAAEEPDVGPPILNAKRVIIILDTSRSMQAGIEFTLQEELQMEHLGQKIKRQEATPADVQLYEQLGASYERGGTRIVVAKEEVAAILKDQVSDVPLDVWRFDSCGQPPVQLLSSASAGADPARVQAVLDGVEPSNSTPILEALQHIPNMLSGQEGSDEANAVNVILLTDGAHTCGGPEDGVCQVSAGLAKQFPFLAVHVVAMAGALEAVHCVADLTKGRPFTVQDREKLRSVIWKASGRGAPR